MRKGLEILLILLLAPLGIVVIGCGGVTNNVVPPPPPAASGNVVFARSSGVVAAAARASSRGRKTGRTQRALAPRSVAPGSARLYLMDHQGALASEVAIGASGDYESVSFSSGFSKIVFSAYATNGYYQLFTANADGSSLVQLTTDFEDHWEPQFSRDGTLIVYVRGYGALATMSTAGGLETTVDTLGFYVDHPIFASNTKILFEGFDDVTDALFAVNTDGTGLMSFTGDTNPNHYDETISLSSDGMKFLYSTYDTASGMENIYIADFHAEAIETFGDVLTNVTPLTTAGTVANTSFDPMFVADRIVFLSWGDTQPAGAGDYLEVYSMNYDGTGLQRLTQNTNYEWFMVPWYLFWS